jgi:hypothetical protein
MASQASIALREAKAVAEQTELMEALASRLGAVIPPAVPHVRQTDLARAMEIERSNEFLRSVLDGGQAAVLEAGSGGESADALALAILDANISEIVAHVGGVGSTAALDALRSAEESGKTRKGVLSAIDKRQAELEAEAEEAEDESGEEEAE